MVEGPEEGQEQDEAALEGRSRDQALQGLHADVGQGHAGAQPGQEVHHDKFLEVPLVSQVEDLLEAEVGATRNDQMPYLVCYKHAGRTGEGDVHDGGLAHQGQGEEYGGHVEHDHQHGLTLQEVGGEFDHGLLVGGQVHQPGHHQQGHLHNVHDVEVVGEGLHEPQGLDLH